MEGNVEGSVRYSVEADEADEHSGGGAQHTNQNFAEAADGTSLALTEQAGAPGAPEPRSARAPDCRS